MTHLSPEHLETLSTERLRELEAELRQEISMLDNGDCRDMSTHIRLSARLGGQLENVLAELAYR